MRRLTPAALLALGVAVLPAQLAALDPDEMFADPAKEARAREIGKQLRCLVCQNQSIFDSNAGLAHDLRMVVRERIEAGDGDAEIVDYVAERFGDYVLLKPPVKGETYLLWAAPAGFLVAALGLGAVYMRRRRPAADLMTDADRAEARRLLREGDPS